ncbi:hypothetical protein ACFQ1S_21545 [Kibdelosporangium lantanae]|uniref:Uncharacterized protein n=1 Tax=Kibdelosporangium lantanae TaxID=1497396 RepID=A0ABW3MBB7_9PSEU
MTETGPTDRRSRAVLFGNNKQEERRLGQSIAAVRALLTNDLRILGDADVRTLPESSPTGVLDEARTATTGTGLLVVYLCGRLFHGPDGVPVLATAGAWDADVLPGVRLDKLLGATASAEQRLIVVDGVTIKPSGDRTQKWLDSLTVDVDGPAC